MFNLKNGWKCEVDCECWKNSRFRKGESTTLDTSICYPLTVVVSNILLYVHINALLVLQHLPMCSVPNTFSWEARSLLSYRKACYKNVESKCI